MKDKDSSPSSSAHIVGGFGAVAIAPRVVDPALHEESEQLPKASGRGRVAISHKDGHRGPVHGGIG